MFGWFRTTPIFASSSNIARNCGASARPGWIFLSTSVFESPPASGSRARNTSAIPPAPSRRRIWYLPNASTDPLPEYHAVDGSRRGARSPRSGIDVVNADTVVLSFLEGGTMEFAQLDLA